MTFGKEHKMGTKERILSFFQLSIFTVYNNTSTQLGEKKNQVQEPTNDQSEKI